MKLESVKFSIKGATPLMMANPASMLQQPAARGPRKKSPEDEQAELASYRDRDGWLCFPALGREECDH
jgi:hypothetical protein